jgi:hypothetical protein
MSYKDELEKRRRARQEQSARTDAAAQARIAKRLSRAQEVLQHIEAQKVRELGVVIENRDARIILRHSATPAVLRIDVDVDKYEAAVDSNSIKSAPSRKTLHNLDDVDVYILDFLEKSGVE